MKKIFASLLVLSVLFCGSTGCSKSYEFSSLQSTLDSLDKITVIPVNNVTMGSFAAEGLSQAYALAPNVGYPLSAFSGGASSIDIVFDSQKFWSADPSGNSNLSDTKATFGTTSLTPEDFALIDDREKIYQHNAQDTDITLSPGQVIFCKTKDGHRSLLLIKSISENGDTLRMDYKVDVLH